MKTIQKFMAIIAALMMTVSMATVCAVATGEVIDETEIEIVVIEDDTENEEPDCQLNCDEPIIEVGLEDID